MSQTELPHPNCHPLSQHYYDKLRMTSIRLYTGQHHLASLSPAQPCSALLSPAQPCSALLSPAQHVTLLNTLESRCM